jgi:peptidoglycan-N-acetylglucosamine deacetylase
MNGPLIAGALTAGVLTGAIAYPLAMPTCQWFGPVTARGPSNGPPRVALTFDDGPWPGATDQILDLLRRLNVRAAFFVIGRYVEAHPELVERIDGEGHLIGNHSFDHPALGFLRGQSFWREQLEKTDAAIERCIGKRPALFRPPLGLKTPAIFKAAAAHQTITWTRRAMDGLTTTPHRILDRLVPATRAGDIVALHDGVGPQSKRDPTATVRAVEPLVLRLRERGLEPVRIDDFIPSRVETNTIRQQ